MKGEEMEEMMMMMMMMMMMSSSSPNNQINEASTCTTWKVYDNPFYCPHHQINFPFWDLTSVMDSELDIARAQVIDLQAELEHEIEARKKPESLNKKLAKELAEQRMGREALESVCDKFAREISMDKAEIDKMKRDFEEERNMLKMAEIIREEMVQIKMAEAKILFEEKLLALQETKRPPAAADKHDKPPSSTAEKSSTCSTGVTMSSSMAIQRKESPETENPHIKRGIKGFVEFPRVVRSDNQWIKSRHWGSKLECQMAQLRILLKQKSPIRSNFTS
ncbi:protein BRANCHLESS TRICHOME-like [Hibiscus syriacus]|uniref:protein BRANCHLESS TRICHOME-like n=1 Tax=Hibiscus syriacus TaxID=106335 RepID=UPI0019248D8C|nr:protein BRANCHLESS TRICHOME-like [Hibiscus syriacus]